MRFISGVALALILAVAPAGAAELWQTLPVPPAMPPAAASGEAPVNDIRMYYAVYGDGEGEPVILLHGGLGHSDVWGSQVPALVAAGFKVMVADSRGHGRSTRSAQPYGYHLMASDVIASMDFLKIDRASILGWSDGGIIGLDIAMNYPSRLNRLFAFGANTTVAGLRPDIATSAVFNQYIENAGKDYARLSKTPGEYEAFVAQIGEMWATQPDCTPEQLGKIGAAVAIADGEYDEAIRQEHNQEMADAIPGAKLVILPGVSHFAMWQNPPLFNEAAIGFLKGP